MNNVFPSRLVRIAGHILTVLSLVYVFLKLRDSFGSLLPVRFDVTGMGYLFSGILFWCTAFVTTTYAWILLLGEEGKGLSFRYAFIVMGKSQIAKYLPGNVFHYVGRVALGTQKGLSSGAVILSSGMEAFLAAVNGFILAMMSVLLNPEALPFITAHIPPGSRLALVLVALCAGGIVLFFYRSHAASWLRERRSFFRPARILAVIGIYMSVFLLFGIVLKILLAGLWDIHPGLNWYQFSCGFALAWWLGFITPGAPGGIGIREAVFVTLFGSQLGDGIAIGLAILIRIMTTLSDVFTFIIALVIDRRAMK